MANQHCSKTCHMVGIPTSRLNSSVVHQHGRASGCSPLGHWFKPGFNLSNDSVRCCVTASHFIVPHDTECMLDMDIFLHRRKCERLQRRTVLRTSEYVPSQLYHNADPATLCLRGLEIKCTNASLRCVTLLDSAKDSR